MYLLFKTFRPSNLNISKLHQIRSFFEIDGKIKYPLAILDFDDEKAFEELQSLGINILMTPILIPTYLNELRK